MHHFYHLNDTNHCSDFSALPASVQIMIQNVLITLDQCYGTTRDPIKDLGGYVVVLSAADDFAILNQINPSLINATFEYVDEANDYLGCLYFAGSDYHIFLVLPKNLAPPNIINQIDSSVG
ncbi:hypothetical protein LNN31_16505 [Acetobacterium wieringae]|uniref:Uncharacterized protein n=1 Tax=Acetobacterium wieringae TaxID=52694 RepID=A0ABY6HFM2_9FIRM|nr:hypothetical protein [Acetobacterium wieringae]UYO62371.1 hypothetical protein LNN31_16505 [Acetobacterium wieringae]VUZ22977.1 Uncharacterised protein [Acetobacterium wieringae]